MGNWTTVRWLIGGVLVASVCLGSPLVTFAETHSVTAQVVIHIPERRHKPATLTRLAHGPLPSASDVTRAEAIHEAITRLHPAPRPAHPGPPERTGDRRDLGEEPFGTMPRSSPSSGAGLPWGGVHTPATPALHPE